MTPRTRTFLGVVGVAVVVAALWLWLARRPVPAPGPPPKPQIAIAVARQGTVEETLSLTGRVGPVAGTQAKLAFSVPGMVASVDVSLGQHVGAGEPLAQLDPTSYSLAAAQAQSEANAADAGAALAAIDRTSVTVQRDEVELARQQRLYAAGIVALRDVEAARTTLWADRAAARSARVALAQAQAQSRAANYHAADARYTAERTTLRAPGAGTVVGIFITRGELVDTTTPAIGLASTEQGAATLDVPGAQLAQIAPGQLVRARSGNARWDGRVAGVASAVDPSTGFAAATVSGVPGQTPAGAPVDAAVVVRTLRGLVVPRDAVIEDPQTGDQLIFVQSVDRNGNVHFSARRVTLGGHDDREALVTSGLRAGERIAASGAIDLLGS